MRNKGFHPILFLTCCAFRMNLRKQHTSPISFPTQRQGKTVLLTLSPMLRKGIILTTIIAVIIGAVGLPVNVHSCTMKGEETVAPTCGMCSKAHKKKPADDSKGKGCCHDRMEIQHTDPASSIKGTISVPAPLPVAILVWSVFAFQPVSADRSHASFRFHSPPPDLRKQASYLYNSSFLI